MIHFSRVLHAVAEALKRFSYLLLVPLPVALLYEAPNTHLFGGFAVPHTLFSFLAAFAVTTLLWAPVWWMTREAGEQDLADTEGYVALAILAILVPLLGMLPFLFSGALPTTIDAYFEAVAGLTTTAATLLHHQAHRIPHSVLFYRGLLSAAGGLAIIVLAVAFLSRLTQGGLHAVQAQSPHAATTRLQRRIKDITQTLGSIYAFLIVILFLALIVVLYTGGVPGKDASLEAAILAMTTLSTGGFTPRPGGIAAYDVWMLEGLLIPFMIIGATGFALHYHVLRGQYQRLVRDAEWRFLLWLIAGATLLVAVLRWRRGAGLLDGLEDTLFTVTSLVTTSGFRVASVQGWPEAAHLVLILLLFIGGATGSTAGGLKPLRLLLLLKVLRREVQKLLHPRAVIPVRAGGRVIQEETLLVVISFFFSLLTLWMFSAGLLILLEPTLGLVDGAATAISVISNTGADLHPVGPRSFGTLLPVSKFLLAALMLIGRLEILPFLLLLRPANWRA